MSQRIRHRFDALRDTGKKGFVAYMGAGDPNLEATYELALGMEAAGVDVLELGIPFSDPLADGLVNQLAAQRGLASGTTPEGVLATIRRIREQSEIPIVLYIYYNLLHRRGVAAFAEAAAEAGVDGILALDLPPEEFDDYAAILERVGIDPIVLIAPTTPEARIATIAQRASGFVYYISREGVTGMQSTVEGAIGERVDVIRKYTELPIAVGFGVSNPEQAKTVASSADAVVVGSAIVNQIATHGTSPELVAQTRDFTAGLVDGAKSA